MAMEHHGQGLIFWSFYDIMVTLFRPIGQYVPIEGVNEQGRLK